MRYIYNFLSYTSLLGNGLVHNVLGRPCGLTEGIRMSVSTHRLTPLMLIIAFGQVSNGLDLVAV